MQNGPRGCPRDIQYHELHLDDNCPGDVYVDTLYENELSSKALVVSSSEEYVQHLASGVDKSKFYDVYWCTHAYNQNTCKKSLMPSNAIRKKSLITTGIRKCQRSDVEEIREMLIAMGFQAHYVQRAFKVYEVRIVQTITPL